MAPYSPLGKWSDALHRAMRTACVPLDLNEQTNGRLKAIGFTNITQSTVRLPISPWSTQEDEKNLGRWFNTIIYTVDAIIMAPLTRIKKWSQDDVLRLTNDIKEEIRSLSIHSYYKL